MASLSKHIKARMDNPELNKNFNREVSKKCDISKEDKQNYALAHESFQEYKKNEPNWMKHFE